MPSFQLHTNVPKESIPENFLTELSSTIAGLLGKPEMVSDNESYLALILYRRASFVIPSVICVYQIQVTKDVTTNCYVTTKLANHSLSHFHCLQGKNVTSQNVEKPDMYRIYRYEFRLREPLHGKVHVVTFFLPLGYESVTTNFWHLLQHFKISHRACISGILRNIAIPIINTPWHSNPWGMPFMHAL